MAAFHGQTVDLYADLEDALGAGWSTNDPDNNVTVASAAAAKAGSGGLAVNLNGDTAGGDRGYISFGTGAVRDNISVGNWVYVPSLSTFTVNLDIFNWGASSPGTNNCRIYIRKSGSDYTFDLRGTSFSSNGKSVTPDAWYWLAFNGSRNSTCTLRVYDASETEVDSGTSVTVTALDNASDHLHWGGGITADAPDENVDIYFDELVADWTDATYPLLGWSSGTAQELSGTLSAISALSGGIEVARALSGTLASQSVADAAATVARALGGTVSAQSGLDAALTIARSLAAQAGSQSTLEGQITVARSLIGTLAATSQLSGNLTVQSLIELAGTLSSQSQVSGDIIVARALAGELQSQPDVDAALTVARELAGTLAAQSAVTGDLAAGSVYEEIVSGISRLQSQVSGTSELQSVVEGTSTIQSTVSGESRL